MKLHETLLQDEGIPNLRGHQDKLLNQISKKLEILSRIIKERKLLVPKDKSRMEDTKSRNLSVARATSQQNKTQNIQKTELDNLINGKNTEDVSEIDLELLKQIQKNEDAEEAIRKMEASKGKLNYYKISEEELAEVASIESSNVDYVEIFGERISQVECEVEN